MRWCGAQEIRIDALPLEKDSTPGFRRYSTDSIIL